MRLLLPWISEAAGQRALPSGSLVFNPEGKEARVHDGTVPGGLLLPTEQVFEVPYTGPGPQFIVAGTWETGFFGEVPVEELLNGSDLASLIGLTAGASRNNDEPWLKFIHRNRILYVAKKPYRSSVNWNHIHARGAVFGTGPSLIEIGEDVFKCRLLTGANEDPTSAVDGTNPVGTDDSEWNQLLYPIHIDDPEGRGWASYTNADLVVGTGDGRISWCQETNAANAAQRVFRGASGVLHFASSFTASSTPTSQAGWRPVLELMGPTLYPYEGFMYTTPYPWTYRDFNYRYED